MAKKRRPGKSHRVGVFASSRNQATWTLVQVQFGLDPSKIKVGLRVGVAEYANALLSHPDTGPLRFFVGTVSKIWGDADDIMTIDYDNHPGGALNISCGIKEYAPFCIALPKNYSQ